MIDGLPKFERPPVVETVLAVQFARLQDLSAPVAGWFWKNCLGSGWSKALEAPRLEDEFERFDDTAAPLGLMSMFQIRAGGESHRLQIIRNDDQRVIQIQDTRFILNWRKREGGYPSYGVLEPEFQEAFKKFQSFVGENTLGVLSSNQWEVTYINHIPKGELWQTAGELSSVLPGLFIPVIAGSPTFETTAGSWQFILGDKRGRLYVGLRLGRVDSTGPEGVVLQFTARGPVNAEKGMSIESGFSLGHETIVRSFALITSPQAHKLWGRTQ